MRRLADPNLKFLMLVEYAVPGIMGCCAIRYHNAYTWVSPCRAASFTHYHVYELCSLFVMPEYRGKGLTKYMTDQRLNALNYRWNVVVEVRPDADAEVKPTPHPEALEVVRQAQLNGFHLVGMAPDDCSPVYYRRGLDNSSEIVTKDLTP